MRNRTSGMGTYSQEGTVVGLGSGGGKVKDVHVAHNAPHCTVNLDLYAPIPRQRKFYQTMVFMQVWG